MPKAQSISISDIQNTRSKKLVTNSVCTFLRNSSPGLSLMSLHNDISHEKKLANVVKSAGVPSLLDICIGVNHKRWAASGIDSLTKQDDQYVFHSEFLNKITKEYPEPGRRLAGKVLDIGCSVGWMSELLQRQFGSNSIGADIDQYALALGRFFGARNLVQIPQNPYSLPFATRAFDSVVSCAVLFDSNDYRCENEDRVLGEISRVMAPNGMLVAFIVGLRNYGAEYTTRTLARHGLSLYAMTDDWGAWKKNRSR